MAYLACFVDGPKKGERCMIPRIEHFLRMAIFNPPASFYSKPASAVVAPLPIQDVLYCLLPAGEDGVLYYRTLPLLMPNSLALLSDDEILALLFRHSK